MELFVFEMCSAAIKGCKWTKERIFPAKRVGFFHEAKMVERVSLKS